MTMFNSYAKLPEGTHEKIITWPQLHPTDPKFIRQFFFSSMKKYKSFAGWLVVLTIFTWPISQIDTLEK